jgi:uncharacterized YigZ family protein
MTADDGFFTLGTSSCEELLERKSRFIAHVSPVSNEEDALAFIKAVKESHKTANHHCYAYIIGINAGLMRYQDDGEPQGTAGIPILEVLKKNNLCNCVAVVIRYFGGILLGAGGLARAYSATAAKAVRSAGVVKAEKSVRLSTVVSYTFWDQVNYALGKLPVCDIEKEFSDKVQLLLTVREQNLAQLQQELASLCDGSIRIELSDTFFHLWPGPELPDGPINQ